MAGAFTKTRIIFISSLAVFIAIAGFGVKSLSQQQQQSPAERVKQFAQRSLDAEKAGLAQPFKGVTTDGNVVPNLFAIKSTGVSTAPVRKAADTFLAALTPEQKTKTLFTVNDDEWRKWMNQHFYVRQGTGLIDMTEAQKKAALGLMRAALSAKGLKLSEDIMKLNHTLGELNNDNFIEYGDNRYYFTVMGNPSDKQPWGWQLDGHHLIINYFVLGDQVVMTPTFWGSEPIIAHAGKYKGISILQEEQNNGLAMVNALTEEQRKKAILSSAKTSNLNVGEAYKDNVVLDYKGIRGSELTAKQKEQLLALAGLYISNMDAGHAKVKISEIRQHLDNTWFSWVGETAKDSVFYYRIHNPVILIEFDHQTPAGLRHLSDPRKPNHEHIHTVVRTPNGNDYGKDLLRQHYQQHPHTK
ncbi:MAG: DUF3500 domain-containing protein [Blastocatellia bacterium]